ncbi:Neuronal acetylcholine receptor subunit alpha-9 [Holothuria leucospilota]|uniref:Neuronal acetylcholine receptor subunit alpha-9 n=1 Tax=Holothuria leucospilota TaxID=206669 RepID=A0A9Q1BHB5_HOLLE|nr:Neuronal acetylcholine receptor subunit alpha-9 [Holothuria leucospilota]
MLLATRIFLPAARLICTTVFNNVLKYFLIVTQARFSRNLEERVRDYLLHENYTRRDRPVLDSSRTVHVTMRLQTYAMLDLNERDEVLTTASWLNVMWKDERLTWNPAEFGGLNIVVMHPDEIWMPKIFLSNSFNKDSLEVTSPEKGSIILTSEGIVDFGSPLVQSTHCPLNVRYFPFDTQICPFLFSPVNQYYEHMYLSADKAFFGSTASNLEWNLLNESIANLLYNFSNHLIDGNVSTYSGAVICLYLQRNPNHYIYTIIIPSTMMCVMAFATFLAPPDSGERISLGVSMVLGLTVFQLLISDTLPVSDKESPVLGIYLTINFALACLTVPLSLININVAYSYRKLKIVEHVRMKKLLFECLPYYLCVCTYNARPEVGKSDSLQKGSELKVKNLKEHNDLSLNRNAVHPLEEANSKDSLSDSEKVTFSLLHIF